MCGIAGVVTSLYSAKYKNDVSNMLKTMDHRGPDATDYSVYDDKVLFGHNRLAIIDLSVDANQPFISNDGNYSIIFNGEIYNYKELRMRLKNKYNFKTNSDTEVLLAAYKTWKERSFDELIGMFSFAIYDKKRKKVILCRDRYGVKPLYYSVNRKLKTIHFGSEIKAFHSAGIEKTPNESMWSRYFTHGLYQYKDETFWANIMSLNSGHYMTINISEDNLDFTIKKWYFFKSRVLEIQNSFDFNNRSVENHLCEYIDLLNDSIKLRFRSDVKIGFNLSGGVDSSVLFSLVKNNYHNDLKETFTFYCADDRYDELDWAKAINKNTRKVLLTSKEVPALTDKVSKYQDEPFGGIPTLAYSKIFFEAKSRGITVLLDGQGMDEAWAGYDYYLNQTGFIVQGSKSNPLRPDNVTEEFKILSSMENDDNFMSDDILNKQYKDLFISKLPRALKFNDRISMMYSTELREPFLDHRLVEYAFSLPKSLKIKNNIQKWGLRQISKRLTPNRIALAPKRPMQTPQVDWLRVDLKDWMMDNVDYAISEKANRGSIKKM